MGLSFALTFSERKKNVPKMWEKTQSHRDSVQNNEHEFLPQKMTPLRIRNMWGIGWVPAVVRTVNSTQYRNFRALCRLHTFLQYKFWIKIAPCLIVVVPNPVPFFPWYKLQFKWRCCGLGSREARSLGMSSPGVLVFVILYYNNTYILTVNIAPCLIVVTLVTTAECAEITVL